ncbi:hypothetical protein SUDANB106_04291 [Streptomyces sp. enrichment culture]|uniref:DUF485 domain-containing protein n=1 Tax=Streptomyces sp. enrichment culture TaxID=1795815 RepID=UPI003F55865E
MRIDDPWHDTLASGWGEEHGATAAPFPRRAAPGTAAATAARLTRPRGAALRGTRGRHRRLVLSAGAALLACHLAYLVAVTAVPAAAGRTLGGGPVTAGTAAGLAQFAAVCLLVWAYARHTRPRGDGRVEAPEPCRCGHEPFGAAGTAAQGRGDRAR